MAENLSWVHRALRWMGGTAAPAASAAPAPRRATRQYAAARPYRGNPGFLTHNNSSADAELSTSLVALRSRSRQMVRDNPYARRAKTLIVNNVIGPGIGLQAQVKNNRDRLLEAVNDDIEWAWYDWSEAGRCHTGGVLCFNDLERAAMGQVFEAGEVLIRVHRRRFGDSAVPLALELIEAERLPTDLESVVHPQLGPDRIVKMGVEVDRFDRPIAYYLRTTHPGDMRRVANMQPDLFERVPAEDIFHLKVVDRWPQARGVPWLHTVLTKLDSMNEYSAAEVQAAKDSACYFATIKRVPDPDGPPALGNVDGNTGTGNPHQPATYDIESGVIQELEVGEEMDFHAPNRPNTAIDPFLRYMLREVAAGIDLSFASLSQNYSDTNYSSSRMSLLDDRDCWRVLQRWWIRQFREPLHRMWMQQAVLAGALVKVPVEEYMPRRRKYEMALFKPRGWNWVDPTKEVTAYKEAVKAGFTTVTDVIAQTGNGQDFEEMLGTRRRELDAFEEADVAVDTTVGAPVEAPPATPPPNDDTADPAADGNPEQTDDPPSRVVSFLARQ